MEARPSHSATEPAHTGVRPLGPYGEGYCRVCAFVVGLDRYGLLEGHTRGTSNIYTGERNLCPGSIRPPAKVTPYSSRKAAFRITPTTDWCPECGQYITTARHLGGRVYTQHLRLRDQVRCKRSGEPVVPVPQW